MSIWLPLDMSGPKGIIRPKVSGSRITTARKYSESKTVGEKKICLNLACEAETLVSTPQSIPSRIADERQINLKRIVRLKHVETNVALRFNSKINCTQSTRNTGMCKKVAISSDGKVFPNIDVDYATVCRLNNSFEEQRQIATDQS